MNCTKCLLHSLQSPLIHPLCLGQLALITVEKAQLPKLLIVMSYRYVCGLHQVSSPFLAEPADPSFYLSQLALKFVEIVKVVDYYVN
jgi:hypothetical protein